MLRFPHLWPLPLVAGLYLIWGLNFPGLWKDRTPKTYWIQEPLHHGQPVWNSRRRTFTVQQIPGLIPEQDDHEASRPGEETPGQGSPHKLRGGSRVPAHRRDLRSENKTPVDCHVEISPKINHPPGRASRKQKTSKTKNSLDIQNNPNTLPTF